MSSINVVSHEEVVGVWQFSAKSKKLLQVVELSMDISANGHRGSHWLNIRLFDQDFLSFCAKRSNLFFWKWFA